jgi:hypothetical protein
MDTIPIMLNLFCPQWLGPAAQVKAKSKEVKGRMRDGFQMQTIHADQLVNADRINSCDF